VVTETMAAHPMSTQVQEHDERDEQSRKDARNFNPSWRFCL
jgi:hypothetical protein